MAELLTVAKRVMSLRVCMVFLLFCPGTRDTQPEGAQGALLPSRGLAALPRAEVFGVRTRPASWDGGGVPNPQGGGTRVLNAEPQGAATSTGAVTE